MNQGLEKIAHLAGVSKSTVSRVINDQPNVNPRTRERVLQIIREVNYRPNRAARALVTQPQPLSAEEEDIPAAAIPANAEVEKPAVLPN